MSTATISRRFPEHGITETFVTKYVTGDDGKITQNKERVTYTYQSHGPRILANNLKRQSNNGAVNMALLRQVMSVQSSSGHDEDMRAFIRGKVKEWQSDGVELRIAHDAYGNLYVTKGASAKPADAPYPCAVCHIDTVHNPRSSFKVVEQNGILWAADTHTDKQVGIGGDDKVGVYIAFEYLRNLPYCKTAFFRDEETGCNGSASAVMDWFLDVAFVLQADRQRNMDFVDEIYSTELGSKKWHRALAPILSKYGYHRSTGMLTDVYQLKKKRLGVCCANASCGYYSPHSDQEYIVIADVDVTLAMFLEIATTMGDRKWHHIYREPQRKTYQGGWKKWDDYDYTPNYGGNYDYSRGNKYGGGGRDYNTNRNGPGTSRRQRYYRHGYYDKDDQWHWYNDKNKAQAAEEVEELRKQSSFAGDLANTSRFVTKDGAIYVKENGIWHQEGWASNKAKQDDDYQTTYPGYYYASQADYLAGIRSPLKDQATADPYTGVVGSEDNPRSEDDNADDNATSGADDKDGRYVPVYGQCEICETTVVCGNKGYYCDACQMYIPFDIAAKPIPISSTVSGNWGHSLDDEAGEYADDIIDVMNAQGGVGKEVGLAMARLFLLPPGGDTRGTGGSGPENTTNSGGSVEIM